LLGYHGISTYDYVVNQRMDQTVNQTLSQFNQLNQNYHNNRPGSAKELKFNPPKVYIYINIYFIFDLFIFFSREEKVIK